VVIVEGGWRCWSRCLDPEPVEEWSRATATASEEDMDDGTQHLLGDLRWKDRRSEPSTIFPCNA